MLMMPITPKVMASPMAASSNTEPSESPYQAFWIALHKREIALDFRAGGRCRLLHRWRQIRRETFDETERVLVAAVADDGDSGNLLFGLASAELSMIAARASVSAFFTRGSVSFSSALSILASAPASRDLKYGLRGVEAPARLLRHQASAIRARHPPCHARGC